MLADAGLLMAGTINANGVIAPASFLSFPTTAGTAMLLPFLVTNSVPSGLVVNNPAVDWGGAQDLYLHWTFANDSNGNGVNNLGTLTDFQIDLFLTSNAGTGTVAVSSAASMIVATGHCQDGTNYPLNYSSGQDHFLAIPPTGAYKGPANNVGPCYFAAQITTKGAAFTTGGIVVEICAGKQLWKNKAYKAGYVA